jgi:hypothetical protein
MAASEAVMEAAANVAMAANAALSLAPNTTPSERQ